MGRTRNSAHAEKNLSKKHDNFNLKLKSPSEDDHDFESPRKQQPADLSKNGLIHSNMNVDNIENNSPLEFTTDNNTSAKNGCDKEAHENTATAIKDEKKEYRLRIVPLEKLLANPNTTVKKSTWQQPTICLDSSEDSDAVPAEFPSIKSLKVDNKNIKKYSTPAIKHNNNNNNNIKNNNKNRNKVEKLNSEAIINNKLICRKFKIKIKRLSAKELGAAKNFLGKSEQIIRKSSKRKMADIEKPTTSARIRTRRRKSSSSDEEEINWENELLSSVDGTDTNINTSKVSESSDDDNDDDDNESEDGSFISSDSEILPTRKKRVFKRGKTSSSDDSDFEPSGKKKSGSGVAKNGNKRKRIKRSDSDDDDDDSDGGEEKKNKRKHIRKIIKTDDLDISTKTAHKQEEERRKRIEERQKIYNKIYEKPESTEVSELILDFDEESKKPLLEVDKGILKKLKPHQVTGIKFMWDACFETLKEANENSGSGCILAHCMGLGKTLQIVALSHTLLTNSQRSGVERVLIISPLSTLTNWAREFKYWMNFARKKNIEIYDMSKHRDKNTRIFKLNEWFTEGGVCILGYDMYRILANEKAKGLRKKQREALQQALVEPGPDLVVCDEGHLLKNEKTSISKAVTKMRTKRRIVLTGTPLQNNLKEYYCMIQFIKPNLLGTYKEYMNRFVNPITNGQYTDSTERDIRLMKHRSHILHHMLEGCIQRRDYSVLAPYLPPKHEYVVYTTLSPLQQKLYEYYMTIQRDYISSDLSGKGARLFQDFQDLRRIWTHPMCLRVNSDAVIRKRILTNDEDSLDDFICDDDDDENETSADASSDVESIDSSKSFASGTGTKKITTKSRKTRHNKNNTDNDVDSDIAEVQCEILNQQNSEQKPQLEENDDPSEWWKKFVDDKELNNIHHSPKMVMLMHLLEQCGAIGDKLLVFSQSLQSLDVIEHFLSLIDSKSKGYDIDDANLGDFKGFWTPGLDYFRLDGSCSVEQREVMCRKFNDPTNLRARLFLISTRAGGLGINLVAANRVVIFDVSWNPSHDTQSIFRVYRFGQEKPCYIYRLIAMGTMEQKVYERQVAKQATAKRVIDEQQISRHYNQSDLLELYTYELQPDLAKREIPLLPKDRLFAELLSELEKLLYKYHEHDSLLENEVSENLTEAERSAAWTEYEAEKTRTVQTAQYVSYDRGAFGQQFGNASGSVTTNRIFGFRSDVLLQLLNMKVSEDHPELTPNQVTQLVPSYLSRLYVEMNSDDATMYKDLVTIHAKLAQPNGMYMSPLLYANQYPAAAGYYQAPTAGQVTTTGQVPVLTPAAPPPRGFNSDEVYEID